MRRLLSGTWGYLVELTSAARRGWDAFFFTPADPTALGLIRVAVGVLAFWSLFVFGLDLARLPRLARLGRPDRDLALDAQRQPLAWSFWFLVPDALLRPAWLVCLAILGLLHGGPVQPGDRRAGLGDRGLDRAAGADRPFRLRPGPLDPGALPGRHVRERPGRLARPFPAAVASRPARGPRVPGRTVPRPAGRVSPGEPGVPSPTISANLALRLIQLHLAFIYGMAGLAKLQGPSWWNGMALWGTMTAGEFVTRDLHRPGRLAARPQLPDSRQPGIRVAVSDPDLDPDPPPPHDRRRDRCCIWGSPSSPRD